MSKINLLQAAALNTSNLKNVPLKIEAGKPAAKSVVAKPAAAKPIASKSIDAQSKTTKPGAQKSIKPSFLLAKPASSTVAVPKKIVKTIVEKIEKEKAPKLKMERDSFTMPKIEYAQFYVLKERLIKLGQPTKKSELLRAGIMQLSAMTDAALKETMNKVPAIKTGRPKAK